MDGFSSQAWLEVEHGSDMFEMVSNMFNLAKKNNVHIIHLRCHMNRSIDNWEIRNALKYEC